MVGESFTLNVVANYSANRNRLDTSPLLSKFIVGSTSVSNNSSYINGKISQMTTWSITLVQQNAGHYTIPALSIDGVSSAPITIKVITQPTAGNTQSDNQDVRLVADFSHDSAYVGQQLLYQVKLYIGASLQRAQLQAPTLEGAQIAPLGEDIDSNEILDGRRYRVITRNYSIKPTQAGQFQLTGSVFRGDINLSGRTSYFNNGRSKPVTLISDSKPFTVRPIPATFPGQWLVSAQVALEDKWSDNTEFTVGEPITRTITLTAANTTPEQLPALDIDAGPHFNIYPDKRTSQQGLKGTTLIAQAVQKIATIPTQPGTFVLPEVKLAWFNSSTGQVEWASIAAKSLEIMPAKDQPQAPVPTVTPIVTQQTPNNSTVVPVVSSSLWYWQLATSLLSLALIVCLMYIKKIRQQPVMTVTAPSHKPSSLRQRLNHAITEGDASQVLMLMPLWLSEQHQIDMLELQARDPQLANAYQLLAKSAYSAQPSTFDFKAFKRLFSAFCNTTRQSHDSLLNLYPNKTK